MLIKLMIRRYLKRRSLLPTLIIKMACSSISNSNMLINNERKLVVVVAAYYDYDYDTPRQNTIAFYSQSQTILSITGLRGIELNKKIV